MLRAWLACIAAVRRLTCCSSRSAFSSEDGAMLRSWDPAFPESVDFHEIVAVGEAPTGDIYVAEYQHITRFDSEGRLLNTIVPDATDDQDRGPAGVDHGEGHAHNEVERQ